MSYVESTVAKLVVLEGYMHWMTGFMSAVDYGKPMPEAYTKAIADELKLVSREFHAICQDTETC